ncbi:hypothetical protein [Fodinibius sp. Rm-B-1B1-1]|uniref:hypothetical protein n=1 Tax=Fodinibius alkaliphilus TaxID=3140241 RepID=UPI00315AFE77
MLNTITGNIELTITVLLFLGTAIGFFKYKFLRRPRINIEVKKLTGKKRIKEEVNYPIDSDDTPNAEDLIHRYHYEINFEIEVLNNSEVDAYDIELEVLDTLEGHFRFFHPLEFSPLSSQDTYLIQGKYIKDVEAPLKKGPNIPTIQRELLENFQLRTKVVNQYRVRNFYTHYSQEENTFTFFKP